MHEDDYFNLKQRILKLYKDIRFIKCEALGGIDIYFTPPGFRHLIYSGKKRRMIQDQIRRLLLFPHALTVLKSNKAVVASIRNQGKVVYWSVEDTVGFVLLAVIVRKIDTGKIHYYSVIPRKRKDPRKGLS